MFETLKLHWSTSLMRPPPPPGSCYVPRGRSTAGSYGGGVSLERGSPIPGPFERGTQEDKCGDFRASKYARYHCLLSYVKIDGLSVSAIFGKPATRAPFEDANMATRHSYPHTRDFLPAFQTMQVSKLGEPGLFSAAELTNSYRELSMLT